MRSTPYDRKAVGPYCIRPIAPLVMMIALMFVAASPGLAQTTAPQAPAIADEAAPPMEPMPSGPASAAETPAASPAPDPGGADGQETFIAPGVARSMLPQDLSPWGMFMAADWVVKAVIISLAFASILTWTVWLAKSVELLSAKQRIKRALQVLHAAPSLHDAEKSLARTPGATADLVRAARAEWTASSDLPAAGIKDRVSVVLSRIEARAGRAMSIGTGLLATIGSTAPFVGLFGTVWGIMNSFIGISRAQTTNLAVVAPGIAEALLATAIGLVVAIPAVVIYNVFARAIAGYRASVGDAAAMVMRLLSRDLDRDASAIVNVRRPVQRPPLAHPVSVE